jgi:hypothetical protein
MAASSRRPQRSRVPRIVAAGIVVFAGGLLASGARADDVRPPPLPPAGNGLEPAEPRPLPPATETAWWREGVAVFANLWDDTRARLTDDMPDWLHHLSWRKPATPDESRAAYVVLQDDRTDGMDLVTLRYRLSDQGPLRAYAGAGFNHSRYFADERAAGPALLIRRDRHSDLGATAELGAELALSGRVRLNADLRWADLDDRADLLHTAYGPVAADPVTLGISLGYRFR